MDFEMKRIDLPEEKSAIARAILEALPEWFGIEESREDYIAQSARLPLWAAFSQGEPVGFIVLKQTSAHAAEICVMGVRKEAHRRGVGRALFAALQADARQAGLKCLQVKTVAEGCYPDYDATRRFYEACGFYELEVFPTLWDEANPCSVMILPLC